MGQSKSSLLKKRRPANNAHSGSLTCVYMCVWWGKWYEGVYIIYDDLIGEPNEFQQDLLSVHKDISHKEEAKKTHPYSCYYICALGSK